MKEGTVGNAPSVDSRSPDRIRATDPLHLELHEFLDDEAALLDEERLEEWLTLLTDDLRYWMPVRASVHRSSGQGFALHMGFYDDTRKSLALRVQRILGTTSGWTEDPPSRTGRFISNVRTFRTGRADEFLVESKLLVTRSRTDVPDVKLLSARRRDILRRTVDGLRLAQREIYVHQATIDMQNLVIFF